MKPTLNPFIGQWAIVEMEMWDQDYVNMAVPGHFTFHKNSTGSFQFGLVQGEMDWRVENADGAPWIEFSWEGGDDMDPASGRGWAVIEKHGLNGRIFFYQGDESGFRDRKV